jgi:hypothetical protein
MIRKFETIFRISKQLYQFYFYFNLYFKVVEELKRKFKSNIKNIEDDYIIL